MANRALAPRCIFHLGCDVTDETLRGSVAPGDHERFVNGGLPGSLQPDVCGTGATPSTLDGRERHRLRSDEQLLLLGRELDHAPTAARIAQRREDPAPNAKVRVAHVSGFGHLR